jgi:hypothetical protein
MTHEQRYDFFEHPSYFIIIELPWQFANSMSLVFTIMTYSATWSSTWWAPLGWWISTRQNWCLWVLSVCFVMIWSLCLYSKPPNVYFLCFFLSATSFLAYRMCRLRRPDLYSGVRKADPGPLSLQMWSRIFFFSHKCHARDAVRVRHSWGAWRQQMWCAQWGRLPQMLGMPVALCMMFGMCLVTRITAVCGT